MANITHFPFLNHLRAEPMTYVQHRRKGTVRHEGTGMAFWFRPRTAALVEIPLDDREQSLLFRARTVDFQEVSIQATVSYRVVDPSRAATRIDFGIAPEDGRWTATPLETLSGLLTELAQQPAVEQIAAMTMQEALAEGVGPVRDAISTALADDGRLDERGLAVNDVRVVAVRADPELERALQTDTRERIQQEADRATYERRALAVERERAIAENELQNQIALARREEELVAQRGQNQRLEATEEAAAARIAVEAEAEQLRTSALAEAAATRSVGEAQVEVEAAKLGAYAGLDRGTLVALALRELATAMPDIGSVTVTPDLVTAALERLMGPAGSGGAVGVAEVGPGVGRGRADDRVDDGDEE
jgi:regulator of protease activity HflC (stomatin/prohibitin superfamily)